jgi:hypothetical protein
MQTLVRRLWAVKELLFPFISAIFVLSIAIRHRHSEALRVLYAAGLAVLLAILFRKFATIAVHALKDPPLWDFRCFWLYGRVALATGRIYEPASFHAVAQIFPYDAAWTHQVLDVGFIYPPPSILLFAPLGIFATPNAAIPYWYTLNFVALLFVIVQLWRSHLSRYSWIGLLAASALVGSFTPTRWTFEIAQTTILLLLCVSLFAVDPAPVRRGLWLGLACIIKPVAAPLLIEPTLRRSWNELASAGAVIIATFIGAMALVGPHNALEYFTNGPNGRYPADAITGAAVQDILGPILTLTHQHAAHYSLLHEPIFLGTALVLTVVTTLVCTRTSDRELRTSLLIALSLLIYPQSLHFYSELLLIPVLVVWKRFLTANVAQSIAAAGYGGMVFLLAGDRWQTYIFASALTWAVCVALILGTKRLAGNVTPRTVQSVVSS